MAKSLAELEQMAVDLAVGLRAFREEHSGPVPKDQPGPGGVVWSNDEEPEPPKPPEPATKKPPSVLEQDDRVLVAGPTGLPANKRGLGRTELLASFYDDRSNPSGSWTNPSPRLTHTDSVGTDVLHQKFSVAERPVGKSATTWGQMALPLREDVTDATIEMTARFPEDWEWSKTGKIGGLVGHYGGDRWPGGHVGGEQSCSVRFTWNSRWWANRGKGSPRFGVYIYGGRDNRTKPQLGALSVDQLKSYNGTRMEFMLDDYGEPPRGQDIALKLRVIMGLPGQGRDTVAAWIDGKSYFARNDLNLSKSGKINFGYIIMMCGGTSVDFGPPSGFSHMYIKNIRITTPTK